MEVMAADLHPLIEPKDCLKPSIVCRRLGIKLDTLRRMRKAGKIPFIRMNCRNYLYPASGVTARIMEANQVA
jgi:excisionase family DNA binding protein